MDAWVADALSPCRHCHTLIRFARKAGIRRTGNRWVPVVSTLAPGPHPCLPLDVLHLCHVTRRRRPLWLTPPSSS